MRERLDINKFNQRMMPTVFVVCKDFAESSWKAFRSIVQIETVLTGVGGLYNFKLELGLKKRRELYPSSE